MKMQSRSPHKQCMHDWNTACAETGVTLKFGSNVNKFLRRCLMQQIEDHTFGFSFLNLRDHQSSSYPWSRADFAEDHSKKESK